MEGKVPLAKYLWMRIRQLGVGHIMGVPGDMNLELLDYLKEVPGLVWVGNANEMNAAYAADGYARVKGVPGVLVTTHGVGELSAINGIAGAYTEQVPVIHIVGATPMAMQTKRAMIHHNLGPNPDHRVYADISARVRCHVAYLDDTNTAPRLIDTAIRECLNQWLPVYIYVPLDYAHALVKEPESKLEPNPAQSAMMNEAASTHIFDALRTSPNRVVLVDVLATRHGALDLLRPLVDVLNCPIYCTPMGKGAIDETHPMYVGIYSGGTSDPGVKEAVESSDCVLHLGPLLADSNTGGFSAAIEGKRLISVDPYQCVAFGEVFEGTHIKTVLKELLKLATSQRLPSVDIPALVPNLPVDEFSDPTITQAWIWKSFGKFLRPNDILIVEAGTAQFGMPDAKFPANVRYITQVYYGCIGYSVGCCAGAGLAQREIETESNTPGGRLILVVGDGSIQLSVQEIGTMIRAGLKPIIVLINNDGYTIERTIHKPTETYHDIAQWRWQSMLDFFGAETPTTASAIVRTKAELESKMSSPEVTDPTQMQLLELRMDKFDAPWRLRRQVEIVKASKKEEP
ncbi:Thiamine pyrophosphate enzyme, central domain-containing protein [Cladophialophora immunda]|nr:Thiamine pyrophosphate enzyme, central domain-containing protein [Cladophialophora immunda]